MCSATLTVLGSGSAFTTDHDNYQSNFVLTGRSGRRLLLDCGTDACRACSARGLAARDIDAVYVSHLHADHAGGLEWFGFSTYFDPSCERPSLFVAAPLVAPLWERGLRAGMGYITGLNAELDTYFDVKSVDPEGSFRWDGLELTLVPTPHVRTAGATVESYGLRIDGEQRIYITGDTILARRGEIEGADVVLHDCEIGPVRTDVHAGYDDLAAALPPELRAKTRLYGFGPGALPDAVADGFAGFLRPGDVVRL